MIMSNTHLTLSYQMRLALFCFSDCLTLFSLAIRSDQKFQSSCTKIMTLSTTTIDDCKLVACNFSANTFHFLNNVCELLNCRSANLSDLQLQPGVGGWDIYVRIQTTELPSGESGPLPVWVIIVIAVVAVLVVVAVVVGTVLAMRRRQKSKHGKDPEYINQEMSEKVQTGSGEYADVVATVESPAEEVAASEYEEIGGNKQYETIQPQNTVIKGPIYDNTEDPEGYQRLGPNNHDG